MRVDKVTKSKAQPHDKSKQEVTYWCMNCGKVYPYEVIDTKIIFVSNCAYCKDRINIEI